MSLSFVIYLELIIEKCVFKMMGCRPVKGCRQLPTEFLVIVAETLYTFES